MAEPKDESEYIIAQSEIISLLEKGVIDNSQAQLIFELFHDRLVSAKADDCKNGPYCDKTKQLYILDDSVPCVAVVMAMWFFLLLTIVRIHF